MQGAVLRRAGSSRFWPYSRSSRPKQFIDFLGTGRSLLQMSYDRVLPIVPKENVLIVTNEQYAPLVREQLPSTCTNASGTRKSLP